MQGRAFLAYCAVGPPCPRCIQFLLWVTTPLGAPPRLDRCFSYNAIAPPPPPPPTPPCPTTPHLSPFKILKPQTGCTCPFAWKCLFPYTKWTPKIDSQDPRCCSQVLRRELEMLVFPHAMDSQDRFPRPTLLFPSFTPRARNACFHTPNGFPR